MPETVSLASQRIQVQEDDPVELLYARGVTDGLPVIPPTEGRVTRMLAATDRDPQELIGLIGPNYGRATVEKVAINAVMAGCRPEYLPVVIAALEAALDPRANLRAGLTTTFPSWPFVVVNGPIRQQIGVNCGRSRTWLPRTPLLDTFRLCIINISGAKPEITNHHRSSGAVHVLYG
jgi:hypothetical protein